MENVNVELNLKFTILRWILISLSLRLEPLQAKTFKEKSFSCKFNVTKLPCTVHFPTLVFKDFPQICGSELLIQGLDFANA